MRAAEQPEEELANQGQVSDDAGCRAARGGGTPSRVPARGRAGQSRPGQPADSKERARSVSVPMAATRSFTDPNFSCPRIRATKSRATCWPYRSAAVSSTNASTVRVRPEKVGLVPTETAAW